MSDHYFVIADQGHLRIYFARNGRRQRGLALDQVAAVDFPAGLRSYVARETSMAGRFQSSKHQVAGAGAPGPGPGRTGMSIDERLPMQREEERRRARDVAAEIDTFLARRPTATWDFAGAPEFHRTVTEQLSPQVRQRLLRTIQKDLVNQRIEQLRIHFAGFAR